MGSLLPELSERASQRVAELSKLATEGAEGAAEQAELKAEPGSEPLDEGAARQARRAGCTSKAEKKAARKRALEESWARKKAEKKAAHKEAKAAARVARQAEWEALSAEEKEARRSMALERRQQQKAEAKERAAVSTNRPMPACAIDLDFDAYMDERDITSLSQQVMYAYGANRRAPQPLRYLLTSVSNQPLTRPDGCTTTCRVLDKLSRMGGFPRWDVEVLRDHYLMGLADERQAGKLVYLSSEAEEVLQELDPACCYIIGGLVDHNRHKGLTHRLATEAGIRTLRLPIDEHLQMSQRRVLAVNHVFEILLHVANGTSWADALSRAVPLRRGAQRKESDLERPKRSTHDEAPHTTGDQT